MAPSLTTPLMNETVARKGLRPAVGRILLCIVVLESSLMGSGRMLQIGPFTVKMLLFSLALLYAVWSLLSSGRICRSTVLFELSFVALLCLSALNGFCHAADAGLIGGDLSPLSAFLILPFFELTIRNQADIRIVMRIILISVCIIACIYALIVALLWLSLWLGVSSLAAMHGWLATSGGVDFFVGGDDTGETGHFFYTGSLYLVIGIIFFAFGNKRREKAAAFLLFLTLFLVASRGLFLTLAFAAIFYVLVGPMPPIRKVGLGVALLVLAATALPSLFVLSGDKSWSNMQRLNTLSQVSERITPLSTVMGHGFGVGVPEKPEHMEITYLEVFHKQGAIGLLWWTALIAVLTLRFRQAIRNRSERFAYPLFLSAIVILVESGTNPFLNNPVGMYPFLISFVGLGVLARTATQPVTVNANLDLRTV
jgi:hypothetical protein